MSLGHRVLLGLLFALYPLTACSTGSDVTGGISSPGDDGGQADAVGGSGSGSTGSGGSSTGSGGTSSASGSSGSGVDGGGSSGAESGAGGDAGGPTGPVWVNLDTSRTVPSLYSFSGVIFGIRVDPRNADVVYVASSNGGLWKSVDYTSANRHWTPMTDAIGQLILGAIDLDPQNPDIVYLGLKDHIQDPAHIHKGVIKSTDGGNTWGPPVVATGTYPAAAGGATVTANEVWDLRVDPTNSSVVLIATDVGMFRSVDAGASFQLVDLPNANPTDVQEVIWTVAYVGSAGGQSVWAASGQCSSGCQGDLWRSADSGATWSSVRAAGNLPIPTGDLQRLALGAGPAADPAKTVVYVEANTGTVNTTQLYRSLDGGTTYSMISGPLVGADNGCPMTSNILGGQGWYDLAVVVDPTDGNHVLFGGQICHARSLDGMSAQPTFSQAYNSGSGVIHPDWHAAFISNIGGVLRTYAGCDGGLFSSTNIFTVPVGSESQLVWSNDNAGLETPLTNTIGSGDPKTNTADVVMSGLQDNGTILGVSQGTTSSFQGTIGGDGSGVAVNGGTAGMFFWGGLAGEGWLFCSGSSPTACDYVWTQGPLQNFPAGDTLGNIRLSPVMTEPSGATFLTLTNHDVWRTDAQGMITGISGTLCDPSGTTCTSGSFPYTTWNLMASPTVPGFYGVTFQEHLAAVTIDGDSPSPHWIVSQPIPSGDEVASIALPPATPPGKNPGDVYAVATSRTGPLANGHLFLTQDHGQSWSPIAGNGSGADLPNVNTYAVRYDPTDMSDNTLYVATDVGIFQTVDGGATWKPFGTGLPQTVYVSDLYVASDASFLRISTTGRGLWELHTR